MRPARGFTLVEVLICLGILLILFFPLMDMVEGIVSAHSRSMRLANLRSDVDRVGYRVQALLSQNHGPQARPDYTISSGNDGVALAGGRSLHWREQTLILNERGGERILARDVTHFSLFRRDGLTTLTLELHDPVIDGRERKRFLVEGGADAARL